MQCLYAATVGDQPGTPCTPRATAPSCRSRSRTLTPPRPRSSAITAGRGSRSVVPASNTYMAPTSSPRPRRLLVDGSLVASSGDCFARDGQFLDDVGDPGVLLDYIAVDGLTDDAFRSLRYRRSGEMLFFEESVFQFLRQGVPHSNASALAPRAVLQSGADCSRGPES